MAGKVERDEEGKLVVKTFCAAHFDQHLKALQVRDMEGSIALASIVR